MDEAILFRGLGGVSYLWSNRADLKLKKKLKMKFPSQLFLSFFTIFHGDKSSHEASAEASASEWSVRICDNSSAHPDDSFHRPASVTRPNQTILYPTVPEVILRADL